MLTVYVFPFLVVYPPGPGYIYLSGTIDMALCRVTEQHTDSPTCT